VRCHLWLLTPSNGSTATLRAGRHHLAIEPQFPSRYLLSP
jgi:hypothetical protein